VLAADIDTESGARSFVHEPGTFIPLLQHERGEVFTYVNDHLGMPKELIDPAGMVAWSAAHSAWGRVVATHADLASELNRGRPVHSPFRLLGQIADEETGLCWTRFRCFDSDVGRWLSPDPLNIAGGTNLFAYDGSPMLLVDPLGLATGSPHTAKEKMSPRAARRAAMREAGIPTSQQPTAQQSTRVPGTTQPGGRQYTYQVPAQGGSTTTMSVQHSLTDRVQGHGPHWEAGPIKGDNRMDPLGRPRLGNDKVKVEE
jgi:RHS repeat-associated protein